MPGAAFCSRCRQRVPRPSPGGGLAPPAGSLPPPAASAEGGPIPARPGVLTALAVLDFLSAAIALAPAAAAAGRLHRDGSHAGILAAAGACALLAGVAVVAGMGLWQLEEYGRRTQLGLAVLGLPLVPVGTFMSILVLGYLAKPGTRLLFSGRSQLSPDEAAEVSRAAGDQGLAMAAAVVGLVLAGLVLLGLAAAFLVRLVTDLTRAGGGTLPA
jgi:hypothetical protein